MTVTSPENQVWIVSEMLRLVAAERCMTENARARAESPPDPALAVVYHEIATADEKHASALETIAVRYGHTPANGAGGGIGEAFARFRDKVVGLGTNPVELLAADVAAKAAAIHWYAAWRQAFESTGDAQSAQDLAAVSAEEEAHRDALQQRLVLLVTRAASAKSLDSP